MFKGIFLGMIGHELVYGHLLMLILLSVSVLRVVFKCLAMCQYSDISTTRQNSHGRKLLSYLMVCNKTTLDNC